MKIEFQVQHHINNVWNIWRHFFLKFEAKQKISYVQFFNEIYQFSIYQYSAPVNTNTQKNISTLKESVDGVGTCG